MSFSDNLAQVVNKSVEGFIKAVSDKYDVDKDELDQLWTQHGGKVEKTKSSSKTDSGKCQARIQSGPNAGNQCKNNVSDKSPSGKYCSRHSSKEDDNGESKSKSSKKTGGCEAKYASGNKQGERCHSKISEKSVTGKYCTKHIGKESNASASEKKSKSKAASDNDSDSEEEKIEEKPVEKPKPSSIRPKKSVYTAVTPENPSGENFVAIIADHRIVFSKATKKPVGVEEIVNEEKKTAKIVPLSEENKEMLKANNITL